MATMRSLLGATALAVLLVARSSPARGQGDEPGKPPAESATASTRAGNVLGPDGANILMIAQAPAVQRELKLTEAQKTRIFDLSKEATEKSADLFRATLVQGANDPQRALAAWARLRQQNEEAIAKILDETQLKRLAQLVYRVEGPLSASRPEVSAKLKLTPAQNRQVQAVVDSWKLAQRRLVAARRLGGAEMDARQIGQLRQSAIELRDAAAKEIGRVLNRKQKDEFNAMLGDPFDLATIDPGLAAPAATAGDEKPRRDRVSSKKSGRAKADTGSRTEKDG